MSKPAPSSSSESKSKKKPAPATALALLGHQALKAAGGQGASHHHHHHRIVNPVKIARKNPNFRGGAAGEPKYFTLDLFPTDWSTGTAVRDAQTGSLLSPTRRIGNKHDEDVLFKVCICTGEGAGPGARGPIHLYYSDVDDYEHHFKAEAAPEVKARFHERTRRARLLLLPPP